MATSSRSMQGELSRRGFLKSTASVAGGLVIACYIPGCSKPEEAVKQLGPPKLVKANAFLQIGTDGSITMFCDKSEMGQGVYTALPTLIAEELGVAPTTIKVEFAPPGADYVNKLLGAQATGGSTSVREAWDKLRMAGAEARTRLIAAAAKEWSAPPQSCSVADGYVVFTSRRKSFGELAEAAAALPPPENVQVKGRNDFKYIGKTMQRLDTPSKVDGSAQFGIDVKLPGMLYAALAQPPELQGTVKSFNSDQAKAMPGVREVLQTSSGVAVVADSWWQAKTARDALQIEWNPGPTAKLNNAAIAAGLKTASSGKGLDVRKEGDADAGWKANKRRVEAVYELPMLAHATLEPQNCTVEFREDGCHVYAPTQVQQMAQGAAAKAAGLPPEKVFVHTTFLGGGFGRRLDVDFIPAAVECAKALNKPVKVLWTREDDTTHDKYRPPARNSLSGAFDANGKLDTVKVHLVAPSITARWAPGAVPQGTPDPFAVEAAHNFPYDVPNLYIDYLQHEVGLDVGYWRSVSHALNCFTVESFMDELATEAGMDPVEFRRSLLSKQPRWLSVLDAAAHKANWGRPPQGRFQGVALMSGYDTYLAQVAEISLEGDKLKVHRIVCAIDCGQMVNPGIVHAQAEGSIVFGLTAALFSEINVVNGRVQEENFDKYRLLRMNEAPSIEIHVLSSDEKPGGMGEPATALVAPAVCNAIYAATKKRLRKLPIVKQGFVV
ncbi:xanthine dehydrogenase family protein molybdopterin-binding subunit [Steroidobacter sp.]|uniref:xanthine dehydrogenase family protein molybdopterin-binding subunit n=1 Tax=Steroidobacter sp. TaxID=1978227 RepID=UPI001A4CDA15|nr:molybdopterin cofactor-binding domain-containing protein [Steroidobacter sp.]MBL8270533.1 xanthine dehydrogenase family protein molybdopterin-binding subunit [Steroidobacter sp.]